MVPSEGDKNCVMAIVGEAPGETEELLGRPFVGHSGQLLIQKLHNVGVARHQCYITNVVKVRPPSNDFSVYWKGSRPKPELVEARDSLLKELDFVNTNVILALGANAMWALTGETKIGKWRGSIMSCTLPSGKIVKVIPTYHPAACLRDYSLTPIMGFDIAKAKKESEFPELNLPLRNLVIRPSLDDVKKFCSDSVSRGIVSFDIETSFNKILCIGLSYEPSTAISIPTTVEYWGSCETLREVLMVINNLLSNDKVTKVAQNIPYDIQFLMKAFSMKVSKPYDDTMIMHHTVYSELPKSLAFITSVYTREPYYKDDLKEWNSNRDDEVKLWEYNAKDACVTLECYYHLKNEINQFGAQGTYSYMIELIEPLLYMMLSGIKVDLSALRQIKQEMESELKHYTESFNNKYPNINPMSSKQLLELAKSLGLKIHTKKGKPTMDKDALDKISHPSFELVRNIRNSSKLLSTYLDIEEDLTPDGKLLFSVNATGTETGRLSSSASIFGGGINMQNVPKRIRNIFVPEDGMLFTEADLVGAEAMVVAYESNDPVLIELFEKGKNIHKYTASIIWGVSEEEVDKNRKTLEEKGLDTHTMYYKAKRIRHAGNYLGSWVMLSEQLKISASEAKRLIKKFYDSSPNLTRWHSEVRDKVFKERILVTPLGRKRVFFGRIGDSLLREALAYIPQETVAHVINLGIINFYNNVCKYHNDINIKLQVHDSVLIEHSVEKTELVHQKIKELFNIPIKTKHGRQYSIPVEIKTGNNWRL